MSDGPIHRHLRELRARVPGGPLRRRRVVAEMRAHLEDAAAEEQRAGRAREDAERLAVERFGVPFADRRQGWGTLIVLPAVVGIIVVAAVALAVASRGGAGRPRALSPAVPYSSVPTCPSARSGPVTAITVVNGGPVRVRFAACRPRPAVGTHRAKISPVGRLPDGATAQ